MESFTQLQFMIEMRSMEIHMTHYLQEYEFLTWSKPLKNLAIFKWIQMSVKYVLLEQTLFLMKKLNTLRFLTNPCSFVCLFVLHILHRKGIKNLSTQTLRLLLTPLARMLLTSEELQGHKAHLTVEGKPVLLSHGELVEEAACTWSSSNGCQS